MPSIILMNLSDRILLSPSDELIKSKANVANVLSSVYVLGHEGVVGWRFFAEL